MIYVDELQNFGNSNWWCHCWSSTLDADELHTFAAAIGLKPEWFQISHGFLIKDFPHYDLRESKRKLALKKGAVPIDLKDWVKMWMLAN